MFICDVCGKLQPICSTPTKVIVSTRVKIYPERKEAGDKGGEGWETVKEVQSCEFCLVD